MKTKEKNEKFISLKEAAKISGYAPDYIGQLIRKGKIPGKMVYSNVAWVTTEEAIREYLVNGKNKNLAVSGVVEKARFAKIRFLNEVRLVSFFRSTLYIVIAFSIGFFLLLFYVFSVAFDKKLQDGALQAIERNDEKNSLDAPIINSQLSF